MNYLVIFFRKEYVSFLKKMTRCTDKRLLERQNHHQSLREWDGKWSVTVGLEQVGTGVLQATCGTRSPKEEIAVCAASVVGLMLANSTFQQRSVTNNTDHPNTWPPHSWFNPRNFSLSVSKHSLPVIKEVLFFWPIMSLGLHWHMHRWRPYQGQHWHRHLIAYWQLPIDLESRSGATSQVHVRNRHSGETVARNYSVAHYSPGISWLRFEWPFISRG